MSLGKKLFIGGAAADAACPTDSVQPFGVDSAYSSNVALYQLNSDGGTTNNVPDTVGNYNGTATNVTYSTGKFGNAAVFNGTNRIDTGITSNYSNYTISLWAKKDAGGEKYIIQKGYYVSSSNNNFTLIGQNGSGNLFVYNRLNATTNQNISGIIPNTGEWFHLVVTKDSSNVNTIYYNGVKQTTSSPSPANSASDEWQIAGGNLSGGWDGSIDQVRIYDKALSSDEVGVLYNETTDTVSDTNVLNEGSGVALYSLDYDASDAGGNYDGTPSNVTFGVDGQINYGASFNGSSSYIDTGQINFGANNISVSLWVHPNASQNAYANIIDYNHSSSGGWTIQQDNTSTNSYKVTVYDGSSYKTSSAFSLTSNQWNHIVFTVTSAGAYSIYVDNGTPITGTGLTGLSTSTNNNLNIGRWYSGTSRYWGGSIDQVRIFKKALSSSEVSTLYGETACVYTSTTDIVDYQGTNLAYYKFDNNALDETTNNYDGAETDITYEFGRYGQAAVFNGSSSTITSNLTSGLTGSFSVSAWFVQNNISTDTAHRELISYMDSDGSTGWWIGKHNNTTQWRILGAAGVSLVTMTAQSGWNHLAIIKDASTIYIYLNGSQVTSFAFPGYWNLGTGNTPKFNIGTQYPGNNEYWDGKIDQVRIFDSALDATAVENLYNEKPEINTSNFETVLYNGNAGSQYVSNVGFEPDLVWVKSRTSTNWHQVVDAVRGNQNILYTNGNNAETTGVTNGITSFNSNGFSLGNRSDFNGINQNYVAWCWKAGGDAVDNTNGNPTSQVSANQDAGFSIVKYTGTGSAMTIGHGLSSAPELIIFKSTNTTQDWLITTTVIDGSLDYFWDATAGFGVPTKSDLPWSVPDSSVINFGSSSTVINNSSGTQQMVAYCFHSVAGYQKIGSYNGSGSSGKVVTTGFKPRFLMIKNATTTSTSWILLDTARDGETQNSNALFANLNIIEWGVSNTTVDVDFTSTGFIIQNDYVLVNSLNDTFIYLAIA